MSSHYQVSMHLCHYGNVFTLSGFQAFVSLWTCLYITKCPCICITMDVFTLKPCSLPSTPVSPSIPTITPPRLFRRLWPEYLILPAPQAKQAKQCWCCIWTPICHVQVYDLCAKDRKSECVLEESP